MEALNSVIEAAKQKARGYRNLDNFITMIYLIAGEMPLFVTRTNERRAAFSDRIRLISYNHSHRERICIFFSPSSTSHQEDT